MRNCFKYSAVAIFATWAYEKSTEMKNGQIWAAPISRALFKILRIEKGHHVAIEPVWRIGQRATVSLQSFQVYDNVIT